MVNANNNDIKDVKDLNGKVVAVKSGTGSVDYAKANIKTKDLRQFPNIDNAYMELGTGRADAVLHDTPNILYFIKTAGNGKFKAVGESLEAQNYGIAFPKGSDELRESEQCAENAARQMVPITKFIKNGSALNPNNKNVLRRTEVRRHHNGLPAQARRETVFWRRLSSALDTVTGTYYAV